MNSASPPIECRSVLALGGARSGKSRYALALAEATTRERLYLATGSAGDEEMAARIERHKAERGAGWSTLEEPLALCAALQTNACAERVILVDCLTFWLANAMFAGLDIHAETRRLCATIAALGGPIVFVSNEVGAGLVPETRVGREFRDWQGRLNQHVAEVCDAVVFIAAGLPTLLKPSSQPQFALR